MIIAGIIILVGIVWLLGVLTKNVYLHNVMTSTLIIMATIQAPLFYYFTSGLLSFFEMGFYATIGVGLTIPLFLMYKNNKTLRTKFHKYGLYAIIIIGTSSLFIGPKVVEYLDWTLRRKTREAIVTRFKNENPETPIYKLKDTSFPPISNGGNEILIDKGKNGELTIEFYIDRGFIDHYSAFVYTDNSTYERELKSSSYAKRLDNNWYKISK